MKVTNWQCSTKLPLNGWILQCIVITSGRVADMYIFGEEPDISDSLTLKMKQAAVPDSLDQAAPGTPDMTGHSSADHSVPFELRMLDTALEEACRLVGVEVRGVVQSGKERLKGLEEEKSSVRVLKPYISCTPHFCSVKQSPASFLVVV